MLGFLDPDAFLGGRLVLDRGAAAAVLEPVAARLSLEVRELARGAFRVMTQNLVTAIRAITVAQGIDPRGLTIVAGGGASGLNCVQFGRELDCRRVLMPRTAGALSACGGLFSDVISSFSVSRYAETRGIDHAVVNGALASARAEAEAFLAGVAGLGSVATSLDAFVDARYPKQVWELETPLAATVLDEAGMRALEETFDALHERVFAVSEPGQYLECADMEGTGDRDAPEAPARRGARAWRRARADPPPAGHVRGGAQPDRDAGLRGRGPRPGDDDRGARDRRRADEHARDRSRCHRAGLAGRQLRHRSGHAPGGTMSRLFDPILLAVIANRLDGIVREMENTLLRTGRSGVINMARDFSCAIVTGGNELLASAEGLPVHIFGAALLGRAMTDHHDDIADGDA